MRSIVGYSLLVSFVAAQYFSQEPGIPSNTIGLGAFKPSSTFEPASTSSPDLDHDSDSISSEELAAKVSASETDSFTENLLRQVYVKVFGKTHVWVTEAREKEKINRLEKSNPVWNSVVRNLRSEVDEFSQDVTGEMRKRAENIEDWLERTLEMGEKPKVERSQMLVGDERPWVILVSEGSTDPISQEVDALFNATLNILFPPNETLPIDWIPAPIPTSSQQQPSSSDSSTITSSSSSTSTSTPTSEEDLWTPKQLETRSRILSLASTHQEKISQFNFGHVSYIQESEISWRWWIWKVPVLVFVTTSTSPFRNYDLRFYSIAWSPKTVENLLMVLGQESRWRRLKVWDGGLAPGGNRDWIPKSLSYGFNYVYKVLDPIPSWILMLVSTGGTMALVGFLHSMDSKTTKPKVSTTANDGKKVQKSAPGSVVSDQTRSKVKK